MRGNVALSIACALCLGVTAVAAQDASAAVATTRVSVQPFSGDSISPGYHVVSVVRGTCPSSGSARRRDSLRCFTGNLVIDPCFRPRSGNDVGFALCLAGSPFGKRLLRIALTEPLQLLQQHPPQGAEYPWAVQLDTERTCQIATGALGVVAGKVPDYYCGGGGALGNRVHEAGTHWWAWFTASYTHPRWVKVGVRLAAF